MNKKIMTLDEYYRDINIKAIEYTKQYTIPIIKVDNAKRPMHHGNRILIEIKNKYFVFSAKHILCDDIDNLYYPINGEIVKIINDIFYYKSDDDSLVNDIACFELENDITEKINKKFINYNNISHDRKNDNDLYLLNGYLKSKSYLNYKEKYFKSSYFAIPTYKINDDKESNKIKLFYNRKGSLEKSISFHPKGMSGSGIWILNTFYKENNEMAKLIGLSIEYNEIENAISGITLKDKISNIFCNKGEGR